MGVSVSVRLPFAHLTATFAGSD